MPPLAVSAQAPRLHLRPLFGEALHSPGPRMALCFVRHFGCPAARAALAEMNALANRFDKAGVSMVAVTAGPLAQARDFVSRYHTLHAMVVDEGPLRADFGLERGPAGRARLGGLLRHPLVALQAAALGHRVAGADEGALPAEFGLEADGRVGFVHAPRRWDAAPDFAGLLAWAGA